MANAKFYNSWLLWQNVGPANNFALSYIKACLYSLPSFASQFVQATFSPWMCPLLIPRWRKYAGIQRTGRTCYHRADFCSEKCSVFQICKQGVDRISTRNKHGFRLGFCFALFCICSFWCTRFGEVFEAIYLILHFVREPRGLTNGDNSALDTRVSSCLTYPKVTTEPFTSRAFSPPVFAQAASDMQQEGGTHNTRQTVRS